MVSITEEQKALLRRRDRCYKDLQYLSEEAGYDFVPEVHQELWDQFPKLDPSKPWALQSEIKKWLILWPRGHFKTTAVVVLILQIILCFPDIRILIMQGSVPVTQTLLHQIRAHFTGENPKSHIRELFPEFGSDRLGNAMNFTVPARRQKGLAQATVTVASPKSIKTGQHYDIGFFDDLVNESNFTSKKQLNKVRENFNMCLPLLDPPFYAVLTGTRYAFGDLYEETMRLNTSGEWKVSLKDCWKDGEVRFPQQPARDGSGRLIGFTREGLFQIQLATPEIFSSQYLNRPAQRGGQRLTKQLLESCLILPNRRDDGSLYFDTPPLSEAVFFIDLAATDQEQSDDSVIIVGKHDPQMVQYVVDCRGDKWVPPQIAQNIMEMALIHRPVKIFVEKTASAVFFVDFLQLMCRYQNLTLPIEYMKVSNKDDAKNLRKGALEGMFKLKKMRFFAGLPRWAKIVEQAERFTGGKDTGQHDDYIDTLGYMAQMFGGVALAQPIQKPLSLNPILRMIQESEANDAFNRELMKTPGPEDGNEGFLF